MAGVELKPIKFGKKDPVLAAGVARNIKWTMYSHEVGHWHPVWTKSSRAAEIVGLLILIGLGLGYISAIAATVT